MTKWPTVSKNAMATLQKSDCNFDKFAYKFLLKVWTHLESISPIFSQQLFCSKVLYAGYLHLQFVFEIILTLGIKCCWKYDVEIDIRWESYIILNSSTKHTLHYYNTEAILLHCFNDTIRLLRKKIVFQIIFFDGIATRNWIKFQNSFKIWYRK